MGLVCSQGRRRTFGSVLHPHHVGSDKRIGKIKTGVGSFAYGKGNVK